MVPYMILSMMIANLAFLQLDQPDAAKFAAMIAVPLLSVGYMREGLLGGGLRNIAFYAPAWKILAIGIAIILIEGFLVDFAATLGLSRVMRSIMGPIGFGIIIASAEVALHRRMNTDNDY